VCILQVVLDMWISQEAVRGEKIVLIRAPPDLFVTQLFPLD